MKSTARIVLLGVVSLLTPLAAFAQDDFEITLEVLDDVSDIDGVIMSLEDDPDPADDSNETADATSDSDELADSTADDFETSADSDELADSSELAEFDDRSDEESFDLVDGDNGAEDDGESLDGGDDFDDPDAETDD